MRMRYAATLALGIGALYWSWLAVPELAVGARFDSVSSRILAGETYSSDEIGREIVAIAETKPFTIPYSRMERAGLLVQMRALEIAMDRADPIGLDSRLEEVSASLRRTIAFIPSDPLLWTMSYQVDSFREGPNARASNDLRLSYGLGPLEGAVALRRNRLGLANFDSLDSETRERVVAEFAGLLDARFMNATAMNLAGPGWLIRDRLLSGLGPVDLAAKSTLIKMFGAEGLRLEIPGMPVLEERPWRK